MKNIKLQLALLALILVGCTTNYGKNYLSNEETKYWTQNPQHILTMDKDSTESSTIVKFRSIGKNKGIVGRTFTVCADNSIPIDVNVKYKTADCANALLVASYFNQDADFTGSDSIALPLAQEWQEVCKSVKAPACDFITFTIEVQGNNDKGLGLLSVKELISHLKEIHYLFLKKMLQLLYRKMLFNHGLNYCLHLLWTLKY